LEKKNRLMSKKEKEIVAFHESGHAIVASLLPNADPVRRISIIREGSPHWLYASIAYGGSLFNDQDRTPRPFGCVAGGGWLRKSFWRISTGAITIFKGRPTLRRAWSRNSDERKIGYVTFEKEKKPLFLPPPCSHEEYSEDTANRLMKR